MAFRRSCVGCASEVVCREETRHDEQGEAIALDLYCPRCNQRLATHYGHVPIQ